jgi:tRNA U34 5-carboxymethylaminomethyl modifying GTPase MnmE/TrmE
MVCGKCNRNNTNIVCYCNSCFQNARLNARQEGRVEGAKTELQNYIKDLEASLEFYECDYGKFEQQVVDKVIEELTENINKFKKRLKELESKGVN